MSDTTIPGSRMIKPISLNHFELNLILEGIDEYKKTRNRQGPFEFLSGFEGKYLHTDAYETKERELPRKLTLTLQKFSCPEGEAGLP